MVWVVKGNSYRIRLSTSKVRYFSFYLLNNSATTYILVYVDDLIFTGDNGKEINHVIQHLDRQLFIKDLGKLRYFLRIEVNRISQSEMHLCQRKYIKKYLSKQKCMKKNHCQHLWPTINTYQGAGVKQLPTQENTEALLGHYCVLQSNTSTFADIIQKI